MPEVLLFTAPRCSQCAAVRPSAVEVASAFSDEVTFREIDASTNTAAVKRHNVRSVPTLIALHGDEELGRAVGTRSRDEIAEVFASASAGERARYGISRADRILRIGIALVFGVAAVAADTSILWAFAAGAALSGVWDLARR